MRVVSLLPSATEIVGELGLAGTLVGRSEECDRPPGVAGLPVVSAARLDLSTLDSDAVDDAVRDAVATGRSLYTVDEELLRSLAADLVLTQDLCAVCAVSAGELCAVDVPTLALDPRTLDEVADTCVVVAEALGTRSRGEELAARMRRELADVRDAVAGRPRRRVFVAEWVDPPYAPGHWIPELVELAGGDCVLGRPGEPSFRVTWDDVRARAPELVVLAPCGYDADRAAREPLPDLDAEVVAVDANAFYARPAPALAAGARQLAHLFHPNVVPDPGLPQRWIRSHPRGEVSRRVRAVPAARRGRRGRPRPAAAPPPAPHRAAPASDGRRSGTRIRAGGGGG
jgi:iron complex transport system substrate-binding protein